MPRARDWPTIRAELEARGFDLDTTRLFERSDNATAWDDWDALAPSLEALAPEAKWDNLAPYLPAIETALAKPYEANEARTSVHGEGMKAAKIAVKRLAAGAIEASDLDEALRRLELAARAARHGGQGRTLIAVSAHRAVLDAAGRLIERELSRERNARLREILEPLDLLPWREVILGDLRFSLGSIERYAVGGAEVEAELAEFPYGRRIARAIRAPGAADRAKALFAARFLPALPSPGAPDDLDTFDRLAPALEFPPLGVLSPDPIVRAFASPPQRVMIQIPRAYRSALSHRRMVRFASLAADLPAYAGFGDVLDLRDRLDEEGWDPFLRNPLRVIEGGGSWTFLADAGKGVAEVRLNRK